MKRTSFTLKEWNVRMGRSKASIGVCPPRRASQSANRRAVCGSILAARNEYSSLENCLHCTRRSSSHWVGPDSCSAHQLAASSRVSSLKGLSSSQPAKRRNAGGVCNQKLGKQCLDQRYRNSHSRRSRGSLVCGFTRVSFSLPLHRRTGRLGPF